MKCPICKEEVSREWEIEKIKSHKMCSTCGFWNMHLIEDAKEPPHRVCMIDGTHYYIGDEDSHFRGFGGAKFQIEFNDGYRVVTTNLWCQGEPSPYWKDKFPNNARFENNLKWTKIGNCSYLCKE